MKNLLIIITFLLLATVGFSQDTTQTTEADQKVLPEINMEGEDSTFIFDRNEYTFIPIESGFYISRSEDGEDIVYGKLRKTTDDGFYILTSNENDETSFGRFDGEGNFRALRFDIQTDAIVEENFDMQNPVERRDQKRRSIDSLQQK